MAGLTYDPNKYGTNKMGSGSGPAIPFKNWVGFIFERNSRNKKN